MKKEQCLQLISQRQVAEKTYEMRLRGRELEEIRPGQFVDLKIPGFYLRRPLSVCNVEGEELTLLYKEVGKGTHALTEMAPGSGIWALLGLGNGFDPAKSGAAPLLLGGGAGVAPLYYLARVLRGQGKTVRAVLGFNKASELFYRAEFEALGVETAVCTVDGSAGIRGFVTAALPEAYSYTYTCGPEPMLKAVCDASVSSGQYSFEERMGCGFGACMGCTCETLYGPKRICKDGPVLEKEEIRWPT